MTRPVTTAFALLLALALAAPAAAQRDTETIDRTLPMPAGGTLRLKTFSGRVKITGGSGDQLVVHAVRRATRDRLADIKLEITHAAAAPSRSMPIIASSNAATTTSSKPISRSPFPPGRASTSRPSARR